MNLRVIHLFMLVVALTAAPAVVLSVPTPPKPNPLASQAKAVNDAKVALDKAKAELLVIRKKIEIVFDVKPEFKAAKAAVEKTKADSDSAARKITASLEKTPDYKAQITKRDKAQAVIDSSSQATVVGADDSTKVTNEDITNATRDRYESGLALKKMEKEAQDADPTFGALQQKYIDARNAWDVLQTQVDDAVKLDPGYPAVEKDIEAAEARYKSARDAYAAAAKALRPATPVRR